MSYEERPTVSPSYDAAVGLREARRLLLVHTMVGFLAGIAGIAAGLGAMFMGLRHPHAASTGWALAAGGLVLAAIALGVMGILRLARAAEAFSEAGAYDVDTTGPQLLAASYLVHGVATLLALGRSSHSART